MLKTAARGMPATRSTLTAMTKDPRVVEAQLGERGSNTDFSDALRKRGIEEIEQEASDEERPDSRRRKK